MKKILLILCLSLGFFSTNASADDLKIGVVDISKIHREAAVMKSLNKQKDAAIEAIKKNVAEKRKEFEKRDADLKKQEESLRAKQSIMDRDAFMKEAENFRTAAQKFQTDLLDVDKNTEKKITAVEKAFTDAVRTIQDDYFDRIVRKIGAEKKFSLVINSQTAIVMDKNLDITTDVIDALNSDIKEMKLNIKD